MPKTLNALIRYKTINSCLYGGKRKWSIDELIDACSAALADARGRYDRISERTIRDDIRVMRSDILGFNAPIEQEKGLYYYSDPQYSIFTLAITDPDLAARILAFVLKLRKEFKHPELESILDILRKLAVKPVVPRTVTERMMRIETPSVASKSKRFPETAEPFEINQTDSLQIIAREIVTRAPIKKSAFLWGDVFEKILRLTS